MKRIMAFLMLIGLPSAFAGQGKGGGDGVALLLATKMRQAFGNIKKIQGMPKHKYSKIQEIEIRDLESVIENKKVFAVNEKLYVSVNGEKHEVTALSDPDTLITKVNIERFVNTRELLGREGLGFHELMVLARVESTGRYEFTEDYISFMEKYMKNGWYCVAKNDPKFECTKKLENTGFPWLCTDDGFKTTFKGEQLIGKVMKRGNVTHYSGSNRKMSILAQEKSGVITGNLRVYYSNKERKEQSRPKNIDHEIYCLEY